MSEASTVIPAQAGIQENDLPKGWQLVELEKICTVDNGRGFKKTEWKNEGLPIIRIQNLKDDEADFNYFAGELDDKHKVEAGDLLFAWSGTPGTSFGAHIWHGPDAALNQHIFNVRFDKEKVDPKYFYFALNQNVARYVAQAQGGVGLAHITKGKFMSSKIPLMSVEQQKRIVAKIEELFSHIDAGIEALKKAKQLLKQYRQSVLKAAVTGELTKEWREANKGKLEPASQLLERILKERREKWEEQQLDQFKAKGKMPKDDKWKEKYKEPASQDSSRTHELPELWSWATFDQIGDRVTVGHVGSMKNEYIDEGVPFLRSQNVRENRYDSKGLKFVSQEFHEQLQKSSLQPGDLVTVRSGSVGVTCVIPEYLKDANCSDLVIVKQPKAVIPKLAAYYMNTITQTKVAAEKVGVALTHFNTKSMAEMPLPVPPLKEQEKIVELVDQKLSEVEKLDAVIDDQLIKSEKNKQAILAFAFAGRIVEE